jgi:hypothetical protein
MSNYLTFTQFVLLEFYFFTACAVFWHMFVEKTAGTMRATVAAVLWPITALLALLYAADRH